MLITENGFRSRKARVNAALVLSVCMIIVATGGDFTPLVLFFFFGVGLLWLMGCKLGRQLGKFLGARGEGKAGGRTKLADRLNRVDVSILGPVIGRLGALWITTDILGEQLVLMGKVGASNWQGTLMMVSAVLAIGIGEKIHRDTIGLGFGRGFGSLLFSTGAGDDGSDPGETAEPVRDARPDWAAIRDALRDSDKTARLWAIGELKSVGGAEAIRLLEARVDDEDPDISASAKEALAGITKES